MEGPVRLTRASLLVGGPSSYTDDREPSKGSCPKRAKWSAHVQKEGLLEVSTARSGLHGQGFEPRKPR